MPAQVKTLFGRMSGAVKQFSLPQKTFAVIAVAAILLGGFALYSWAAKPTLAPLFSGLSATDASAVVDQLSAEGVTYELTDGGSTVLVPQDRLYDMRLSLAAAGLPANAEGDGYSLLDGMSMTSSEFQQQTTYTRALEGELAKTVGAMSGVEAATVKLALPEESVFVSQQQDPTASVFVRTKTGTELSNDQVEAIVHLVSAGIEGMKATDVAVVDSTGKVLSEVGTGLTGGTGDEATSTYEQRVTGAVQALLDQVVGAGNSAVTVTASLNQDQTQRTSEEFTASEGTPPLVSSTTTEEYEGTGGGNATGVLGPDNIAVPNGDAAGTGTYTNTTEDVSNAVNKVTEVTTVAAGTVERQSLAVLVDQTAAAGIDLNQLTATLTAAAGIDAARGDTIAVQAMAFDTTGADAAAEALAAADAQAEADRRADLLRQAVIAGALLLVVVVVAIVLARRSRRSKREALDIGELPLMDGPDPAAELEDLPEIPPALPGPAEVDPVAESLAVKRAEIAALADEQPEEVADLLRGWLTPAGRR
ncbi:flagellar basal-body MS-ring/collar protein FliF [Cellulomonas pakistanensis]|uniref:Flagellar M-ring protein n=1 Tax=Cellulomonas pakistanensis TaxID=992287 RepID=A0A919P9L0_9CELL|nr:flagellar basal-body MS-ring/collar protein FliF [Cellulomonas pakistanensis]GIG35491.1 flagellar M-ring protein [Cellulomonas pakistanensis]